jgi:predicted small integral membrane protein
MCLSSTSIYFASKPKVIPMLRIAKIALIFIVACWALIAAFQNIADWQGTLEAVGAATSMATFEGGAESWQATSNIAVIWLGALFILGSKIAAGGLCLLGAWRMWVFRQADETAFRAGKQLALVGCTVALVMLFGGFVVIAESWFELWRSDAMRGPVLDSAFRYAGMIALIALFVSTADD